MISDFYMLIQQGFLFYPICNDQMLAETCYSMLCSHMVTGTNIVIDEICQCCVYCLLFLMQNAYLKFEPMCYLGRTYMIYICI